MRHLTALFALTLLASVPASAAWQSMSATDFEVPPPPAPGSPGDQQDFATLFQWQATRTPQQCSLAAGMTVPDFQSLYAPSGILTSSEMTTVQPFLDAVSKKVSAVAGVFKKEYARPRPYNENKDLQPCADKPGGATAYPSAHATEGAVDACVLGQIFPDRAQKLADWGRYVGELRVISGVHHPTDVAAGQALAASICSWLLEQGDFNAQVSKLRTGN
ncbi:MAG TPA: phosphatase PAP2 family protein [Elusimicrobiota bacterium]|nr:phosphatase PAP2 family protein [Elusimicrobiota bacterium]